MSLFAVKISGRSNFIWLLVGLVFFLFAGAVADQFQLVYTNRVINVALMLTLVLNIWCIDNPHTNFMGWKAGATFIIITTMITDSVIASNFLAEFQLFMTFLFLALTTWQAWSQVMFTGRVDRNKVVGSVCIYLLLGLLWAFAYLIVDAFLPGSFRGLEETQWQQSTDSMVYYSFVTLTTLGYGDITPQGSIARFLAYSEAITGVFYMAILVASLIGIRLAGVNAEKPFEESRHETREAAGSPEETP